MILEGRTILIDHSQFHGMNLQLIDPLACRGSSGWSIRASYVIGIRAPASAQLHALWVSFTSPRSSPGCARGTTNNSDAPLNSHCLEQASKTSKISSQTNPRCLEVNTVAMFRSPRFMLASPPLEKPLWRTPPGHILAGHSSAFGHHWLSSSGLFSPWINHGRMSTKQPAEATTVAAARATWKV